ncbi:MAG: SDR family NAD(P)-dependent oxidoreductase [Proteobacteria bacterium]|nr:SDR family NAD(P)-dependent oxidoreductase [Pseudomonadota bacterium]
MSNLDGKRAVVTGAASGLGRALALVLARKGCKIGIADINEVGSRETLELVERAGGSGEILIVDVRRPESVKAMADHFFSQWKGVDLLVNNAGIAISGLVGEIPLANWEKIMGINFWGMLYGCHEFIPRMKRQGGGHILNIASAAGLFSMTNMGPYNATKAAVISLSETLKPEVAPFNIGITVACPMFFNTNLVKNMQHTEEVETEFANAAFQFSRITSEEVARRIIRAVEKGKFYVIPMLSGKVSWMLKRLSPSIFYGTLAFFSRRGWLMPMALRLARWGMV